MPQLSSNHNPMFQSRCSPLTQVRPKLTTQSLHTSTPSLGFSFLLFICVTLDWIIGECLRVWGTFATAQRAAFLNGKSAIRKIKLREELRLRYYEAGLKQARVEEARRWKEAHLRSQKQAACARCARSCEVCALCWISECAAASILSRRIGSMSGVDFALPGVGSDAARAATWRRSRGRAACSAASSPSWCALKGGLRSRVAYIGSGPTFAGCLGDSVNKRPTLLEIFSCESACNWVGLGWVCECDQDTPILRVCSEHSASFLDIGKGPASDSG